MEKQKYVELTIVLKGKGRTLLGMSKSKVKIMQGKIIHPLDM